MDTTPGGGGQWRWPRPQFMEAKTLNLGFFAGAFPVTLVIRLD